MRTEECDNACYLPFWVTNPLITKCKVATRNPGPILLTQMQITASVCQPMTIILEGLLEDQSQVRTEYRDLGISSSRHKKDDLNICGLDLGRTRNGVRPGPSRGKWTVNMGLGEAATSTGPGYLSNKHCEILVSCSDDERNCMQA